VRNSHLKRRPLNSSVRKTLNTTNEKNIKYQIRSWVKMWCLFLWWLWIIGLMVNIIWFLFMFLSFTTLLKWRKERLWLKELSCIPILALTIENLSLFVYQQNKVYKSQFAHEKRKRNRAWAAYCAQFWCHQTINSLYPKIAAMLGESQLFTQKKMIEVRRYI
jgi:hypothetical protein